MTDNLSSWCACVVCEELLTTSLHRYDGHNSRIRQSSTGKMLMLPSERFDLSAPRDGS